MEILFSKDVLSSIRTGDSTTNLVCWITWNCCPRGTAVTNNILDPSCLGLNPAKKLVGKKSERPVFGN